MIRRLAAYILLVSVYLLTWLVTIVARRIPRRSWTPNGRILVTGTIFNPNWYLSHITPLVRSGVKEVILVVDRPQQVMEGVQFVCPPRWLMRLISRAGAKAIWVLYAGIRYRPDFFMGYSLVAGGCTALVAGAIAGRPTCYQMTGGSHVLSTDDDEGHYLGQMGELHRMVCNAIERLAIHVIRRFDLVVVRGNKGRAFLARYGIERNVTVITGSVRMAERPKQDRAIDLIFVGRLSPIKQIDQFIRIVERVSESVPSLQAVIVGDGTLMADLKLYATQLGLDGKLEFLGKRRDVEDILARSKVFVLPSKSEGLSIAMAEAMSLGVVPVVADVGELSDLVHDGLNGHLIEPNNIDEYVVRILPLLQNHDQWSRLSDRAIEAAREYSHVDVISKKWQQSIRSVLQRTSSCRVDRDPDTGLSPSYHQMKRALSRKNLWSKMPASIKSIVGGTLDRIPPAFWCGRTFRKQREHILEVEWWPAERTREYQTKRVREILKLAYENTRFYREMFERLGAHPEDIRTLDDLRCLPSIDRESINQNLAAMCTRSVRGIDVDFGSTGGMSGTPLHFYVNASRSYVEYAYLLATWERIGYRLGMPMAVLRGQRVRVDRNGLYHEYDPILRHHHYSSFHMSDENMERYVEHMAGIGPCVLHGYPSTVFALAQYILRSGRQAPPNIQGLIVESEIVYPRQRQIVEEIFGRRLLSCYGQSEKVVLGGGCEDSDDYHIWPTYGCFELLDANGDAVTTPGQRGEIVGTGFINTVMPFIRYRTGDWATYVGGHCEACGREHILIRDISGHRTQEVLIAADGSEIPWTAVNMHDDTFINVRQFQFFQQVQGQAVLRIVPVNGFGDKDLARIRQNLRRKLDDRLTFAIELVEAIPLSSRGKAVYVDQRIPLSSRAN